MQADSAELLRVIHAPKRRKDQVAAIERLQTFCHQRYRDMIEALRAPEYDQARGENRWFGPTKKLIVEALFTRPSKKLVKHTSYLLNDENGSVRWAFAHCACGIGELYTIDVIERSLTHADPSVRAYASYALRDVAERGNFTPTFALRAGKLLLQYIREYPNEAGHPRFVALETFAPDEYRTLMDEAEPADPREEVLNTVFEVADEFTSHKDALTGFSGSPPGFLLAYSLHYVDADIRNGGIYQLYANTTWHLILDAITACQQFGFTVLADVLHDIVYYYYKRGRSRLKRRIPKGFAIRYTTRSEPTLSDLEDRYYDTFDQGDYDGVYEFLLDVVQQHPDLFE